VLRDDSSRVRSVDPLALRSGGVAIRTGRVAFGSRRIALRSGRVTIRAWRIAIRAGRRIRGGHCRGTGIGRRQDNAITGTGVSGSLAQCGAGLHGCEAAIGSARVRRRFTGRLAVPAPPPRPAGAALVVLALVVLATGVPGAPGSTAATFGAATPMLFPGLSRADSSSRTPVRGEGFSRSIRTGLLIASGDIAHEKIGLAIVLALRFTAVPLRHGPPHKGF
jgi:hypothetical protein